MSIRKEYHGYVEYRNENGECHREDGPAVEFFSGGKQWYINGKCHRIDGPAIITSNGKKYYYLNDKEYSYEKWKRLKKMLWLL